MCRIVAYLGDIDAYEGTLKGLNIVGTIARELH
jgi:hypothetical protein